MNASHLPLINDDTWGRKYDAARDHTSRWVVARHGGTEPGGVARYPGDNAGCRRTRHPPSGATA